MTHSYWSEFFNRAPFDVVRDIEYDEPGGPITHGRFHTMHGYGHANQMTPSDYDLFGTLTRLCEVKGIDYGILHTCTLDSMGHRFFHDCEEMDHACFHMDAILAPWIHRWRQGGYEVIVTADHGQDARGHHGGTGEDQRDFAFYYFGNSPLPPEDEVLDQLALGPLDPDPDGRAGAGYDDGEALPSPPDRRSLRATTAGLYWTYSRSPVESPRALCHFTGEVLGDLLHVPVPRRSPGLLPGRPNRIGRRGRVQDPEGAVPAGASASKPRPAG